MSCNPEGSDEWFRSPAAAEWLRDQFMQSGPWAQFAEFGMIANEKDIPEGWALWKNLCITFDEEFRFPIMQEWDYEPIAAGRVIVSWPVRDQLHGGRDLQWVGLYVLRPPKPWRALAERILHDEHEIDQVDLLATVLAANWREIARIGAAVEAAEREAGARDA